MAIKKFIAEKDTTITNALKSNLQTRSIDSNMGASDILEVYTIYGRGISGDELESSRILISFPITEIANLRQNGKIPSTGNVSFVMKLCNAPHGLTLPFDYELKIHPVTKVWSEGIGLDMEDYSDRGASRGGLGSDWKSADVGSLWDSEGGDYDSEVTKTVTFSEGYEDLEVDITDIVESWIEGTPNYGLMIKFPNANEDGTLQTSFYTKKFFARSSEYFFQRPALYALWNSSEADNRGNFYKNSLLSSNNDNILYLKNSTDIPTVTIDSGSDTDLTIKFYSDLNKEAEIQPDHLQMEKIKTGVYKAIVSLTTEEELVYVDWQNNKTPPDIFYSEELKVLSRTIRSDVLPTYITNIVNMKTVYSKNETARFRLYSRLKDWTPTIYTKASRNIENSIIEKAYFKIVRVVDEQVAVDFGVHTLMSYDKTGNYFDFDMTLLEPEYSYRIELQYEIEGNLVQQPETFKFRVE